MGDSLDALCGSDSVICNRGCCAKRVPGLVTKVCWARSCCRGVPLCGSLSSPSAKETLPSQNGGGTFCLVTGCSGGHLSTLECANPAGMYVSCLGAIIDFLFVLPISSCSGEGLLCKGCNSVAFALHSCPLSAASISLSAEQRLHLMWNDRSRPCWVHGINSPESHGTFGSAELAGLPQNLNSHVWFQFWLVLSIT